MTSSSTLKRALLYLVPALAVVLIVALLPDRASNTEYPEQGREVRHIIPWRSGGGTDTAMRGFMRYFEEHFGIPVITENIPGGVSSIGLNVVKSASGDGYTIGTMTYDVLTVEFLGLAPLAWTDFEVICTVTEHPSVLIAHSDNWGDLADFQREAQNNPGIIRVGNAGAQGVWHQHAVALERAMDVDLHHVPYGGTGGGLLSALLGGEVDAVVSSLPAFLPYIQDETLMVLGVMASDRNSLVPEAPTFLEQGYDLRYGSFRTLVAPRGTPQTVLSHLEETCRVAWNDEDFQNWATSSAIGAEWRNAEESRAYLQALAPNVRRLMEQLGL